MKPREEDQTPIHWTPWIVAGIVVSTIMVGLTLMGRMQKTPASAVEVASDPYATHLPIRDLKMSESVNFAGGKVTYIDGQIANTGEKTITGITVQAIFHTSVGEPPQRENEPLALIRTHEPYVDTQAVSAAPLKPGDQREFRIIMDHVTPYWDGNYPDVRVIHVDAR